MTKEKTKKEKTKLTIDNLNLLIFSDNRHKADIGSQNKDKEATKLARHMWELQEQEIKHEPINWSIKARCKP